MIIQSIKNSFERAFSFPPSFIVRAPGRINLIGEHTDYNKGYVFPAAINKYVYLAFSANVLSNDTRIVAKDIGESASFDLSRISKSDKSWKNFLAGILRQFQEGSHALKNFNCLIQSTIPIGAGMSSSSALECGFAKGIAYLNNIDISNWELVNMSHRSNHEFLGIKGGIMDQFASLFGKVDKGMLLDCIDRSYEYVSIELENYQWVLINTNVKHENLTSGYGDRVQECNEVTSLLGFDSLRTLTINHLEKNRIKLSELAFKRAQFVLKENERVKLFAEALRNKEYEEIGSLLYASHDGLKNKYEVSCKELDLLVDLAKEHENILGARMMGGGFGGCTLNLIKKENIITTIDSVEEKYFASSGIKPESYIVKIVDGVTIL